VERVGGECSLAAQETASERRFIFLRLFNTMANVLLKTPEQPQRAATLLQDAVQTLIDRLERSLQLTRRNLEIFETKYQISSEEFIQTLTAEDLDGGDFEYVEWQGEYKFFLEIVQDLKILKGLEYVPQ
jgi:hypothetical protein